MLQETFKISNSLPVRFGDSLRKADCGIRRLLSPGCSGPLRIPSFKSGRFSSQSGLLGNRELVVGEGYFVTDLHLEEEPLWVALEDFGKVRADVSRGLTESIHDPTQRCFVNAEHSGEAILSDTGGVHA